MKTNFLKTGVVLLFLGVVFVGCERNNYPKEVPFTEFSLEADCQWYFEHYNDLVIINNDEELKNHIHCSEGNYPDFDFSEKTLLLARGVTPQGISKITKNLRQLSTNEYVLVVEIVLNDATVVESWQIALVANKLTAGAKVQLRVNKLNLH